MNNIFAVQEQFTNKQYFIDSAQMLTECLYVIQKTGRFDIVEKQILSNAKIGKIPHEFKNISKRIIDTCQQGRISLRSEEAINKEFEVEVAGIGIKAGSRIGTAIAMEDPVSAIWAVYEGVAAFSNVTAKNNQRISSVLQQLDYRIKSDMYDLRNCITENAEKYDVDAERIITFESLEELERMLPKFSKNPDSILPFMQQYPYYAKLKYYAIKHESRDYYKIFFSLISSKNSILYVDQDRLNVCAAIGEKIICLLIKQATVLSQNDRSKMHKVLIDVTQYGLRNGGHACSVFHFMRGVANSFAQYYGLNKMSDDDIWNDLLYEEDLDQGEYMGFQSLWCAAWISCNFDNSNSKKELLPKVLKDALEMHTPSFLMMNSPFHRPETAQEVYKDLFKVRFEWNIDWGFFHDDIVLINKSPFPLRNVVLSVSLIRKSTYDVFWQRDLKCSYIPANGHYLWNNIMSIPNGSSSTVLGNAQLWCDESVIANNRPPFLGNKRVVKNLSTEISYNHGKKSTDDRIVQQEDKKGVKDLRKEAENGDAEAQFKLAQKLADGSDVSQNDYEAVKWYQKSAKQGHVEAQVALALMYEFGRGITPDEPNYIEAKKWFLEAANKGSADAQYELGLMYESGWGVAPNTIEAYNWYRKAAAKGHAAAKEKLQESIETDTEGFILD